MYQVECERNQDFWNGVEAHRRSNLAEAIRSAVRKYTSSDRDAELKAWNLVGELAKEEAESITKNDSSYLKA